MTDQPFQKAETKQSGGKTNLLLVKNANADHPAGGLMKEVKDQSVPAQKGINLSVKRNHSVRKNLFERINQTSQDRQTRLLKIIRNGENCLNQINQKDRMGQRNNQKQVRPCLFAIRAENPTSQSRVALSRSDESHHAEQ